MYSTLITLSNFHAIINNICEYYSIGENIAKKRSIPVASIKSDEPAAPQKGTTIKMNASETDIKFLPLANMSKNRKCPI